MPVEHPSEGPKEQVLSSRSMKHQGEVHAGAKSGSHSHIVSQSNEDKQRGSPDKTIILI